MARIRTIKPEFWEDEAVGLLSLQARLLFIASWNLADDEGLLRWTASYLKAAVFMYDEVDEVGIAAWMAELEVCGMVFPYRGGKAQQRLACIVTFHRHQKVNRPSPPRYPPPSLQNLQVRHMYARRDGWLCHLCGGQINEKPSFDERLNLSMDHYVPRVDAGTDFPSNIRAAHVSCNKSRGANPLVDTQKDSGSDDGLSDSLNGSQIDSVINSLPEGKGREGKGKGRDLALLRERSEFETRPRDELWDAVMAVCRIDVDAIPKSARSSYGKVVSELRQIGATSDEVHRRGVAYRLAFPNAALTPPALLKHWAQVEGVATQPEVDPRQVDGARWVAERSASEQAEDSPPQLPPATRIPWG